jgi:hypothetical protein
MIRQRGFALFEVLLAVVLMMIAAAGAYTLVKSFRANSAVQQFIRYSTNITQSFMPFVDGNSYLSIFDANTHTIATSFLKSIGIPAEDQVDEHGAICAGTACYVDSGMYLSNGAVASPMNFQVKMDNTQSLASYFIVAVAATGVQVNQVLQNASSLFSVYCLPKETELNGQSKCALQSDANISSNNDTYSLFLVFPKSGDYAPTSVGLTPLTPPTS